MDQETTIDPRLAEITQVISDPAHAGAEGVERPDRVIFNNELFNEVVAQGDLACTILAGIRWRVLEMGRKTYADETDVQRDVIRKSEDASSRHTLQQRYDTVHKFITYWRTRPEVGEVLTQAAIDAILAGYANTVYGLFLELEYRLGHGVIEGQTGITLSAVRSYRDSPQSFLPFDRIKAVIDSNPLLDEHGVSMERMRNVWAEEARRVLTGPREVPVPLAELHVQDQMKGIGLLDGHRSFKGKCHTPAFCLARFEMRPWDEIADIASELIPEHTDAFQAEWDAAYSAEIERETFYKRLRHMQTQRGYSNHKMKRIMGLEGVRPFAVVRDPTIEGKANANVEAPPAVLAHVLAENPKQAAEVIALFRADRTRWRVRMGSLNADEPIRLDREQWGVTNADLIEFLYKPAITKDWTGEPLAAIQACRARKKWTQRDLVRAENAQGVLDKDPAQDVLFRTHLRTIIAECGRLKAQAAIDRRNSYQAPKTVTEGVIRMVEEEADGRTSGTHLEYRQLARKAKEAAPNGKSGEENLSRYCTRHHLRRYAEGIEVPALPVLLHLLKTGGIVEEDALAAVKLDWADRFAKQLAGMHQISPATIASYPRDHQIPKYLLKPERHPPLARALLHCIGRVSPTMTQFARTRFVNGGAADMVTQCIKLLDAGSTNAKSDALWANIEAILLGADIVNDSETWKFVRALYEENEHVNRTLAKMATAGITGDSMIFPGLTKEDIEQ